MIELSVVIPTFNRVVALRRCLDALSRQSAPPDAFEIVVVDDGSRDATPELLAAYESPVALRVERQENAGQASARNLGVARAAGAYCLFVDDDILAEPDLVAEHLRAQRSHGGVLALGALRLRIGPRAGGTAQSFALWWEAHYRRLDDGVKEPDFWACYTGNLSAPTAAVRSIGGFDESLRRSDDVEFAYRLVSDGLALVYLPRAAGVQHYTKGFRAIVRDFDGAGAAAVPLMRKHPELVRYAPLGDFAQGGKSLIARRLMLALRVPVWPLGAVDPLLRKRPSERLYRFLQLYCYWRGVRRALDDRDTWARLTRGTVILMYHAIGAPGERPSRFVISKRRLRRQLDWIRFCKRPVLTLDEYVGHRLRNELPPPGAVVLTFDDGYVDNAEVVPLLRRHGYTATIFLVTAHVGDANRWDGAGPLGGRPLLSWQAAKDLQAAGLAIGSHSVSHPRLGELDADDAAREIQGAGAAITSNLGSRPAHFAYPFGSATDTVRSLVADAGYDSACSIEPGANGPAVPLDNLRRLEVTGTRSLLRFAVDLWLGRPLVAPKRGRPR